MSPLRVIGDRPLAIEAAQIAETVVAALLDINETQIYQSSRQYLYHAVIGAIAIANTQERRARLEDVYTLLRPAKEEFRNAVAEACADQPDLDQTAEFFRFELPDDLRVATSRVAERLDAPRNKISCLTDVPPLRRFFNRPSDVPLRETIQARDILIVDANMGAIGTENSKAYMLFILRMLRAQLQPRVHLPENERPRVPLLVDEAHYVAGGENVVDHIATHRAAGLEPALGLQYFAQLGSASEHQQKSLKGVLNLLQSGFLFRMGDAQDAEQATRIAMAVYSTMIRDDPESRARLRVTPSRRSTSHNYYSPLTHSREHSPMRFLFQMRPWPPRHPAATGPDLQECRISESILSSKCSPRCVRGLLPSLLDRERNPRAELYGEDVSAAGRRRRVGSAAPGRAGRAGGSLSRAARIDIGEDGTSRRRAGEDGRQLQGSVGARRKAAGSGAQIRAVGPADADRPVKREVKVDYEPPEATHPNLTDSPVRRLIGRRRPASTPAAPNRSVPDTLRELAFLDRINRGWPCRGAGWRRRFAAALRRGPCRTGAPRPGCACARRPDRTRRSAGPRAAHRG